MQCAQNAPVLFSVAQRSIRQKRSKPKRRVFMMFHPESPRDPQGTRIGKRFPGVPLGQTTNLCSQNGAASNKLGVFFSRYQLVGLKGNQGDSFGGCAFQLSLSLKGSQKENPPCWAPAPFLSHTHFWVQIPVLTPCSIARWPVAMSHYAAWPNSVWARRSPCHGQRPLLRLATNVKVLVVGAMTMTARKLFD